MITLQEALDKFKKRDLSWSSISKFTYGNTEEQKARSREEWFENYILDKKTTSPEMIFGSIEGKKMENDPNYFPQVPRYGKDEYAFKVVFNKIPLVGYADTFDNITWKRLGERKTGVQKWDQKRVNQHGQLSMYALMNYIQNKINPGDVEITLTWLPTKRIEAGDFSVKIEYVDNIEQNIKTFKTKRTMTDILKFGAYINATYKEMEQFIIKKLSTTESLQ